MSLTYPSTSTPRPRGQSRTRRHTHDIDSPEAKIHAPLGGDGTIESASLEKKALLELLREVQIETANAVKYGQGFVTDVAIKAVNVLLDPKHGYDFWSGTNDLAGSEISERGGFSKRQWQRVKPLLADLGIMSFVHRSIKSGLERAPGVDQDLQISDLYWFSPTKLVPWLRDRFVEKLAQLKRERYTREQREGIERRKTPLAKRDRPKCRIPAKLNPVGWARCLAAAATAKVSPSVAYAAREAEAVAFATRLARNPLPG